MRLPLLLQEITDGISLNVALKLAEHKGGQRVSIPNKLPKEHWLIDILGEKDAKALCKLITHEVSINIDIPLGPYSNRAKREAKIQDMLAKGATANEIVKAANIDRRQVFRKKAKAKRSSNTPNLFSNIEKKHQG